MNPNRVSTKDLILYASVGASIAIALINSFCVRTAQKTQLELLIKDKLLTDMCVECGLDHSKIWNEINEIKMDYKNIREIKPVKPIDDMPMY